MQFLEDDFTCFVQKNSEEGIFGFDKLLNCIHWNPAMERLTDCSKEDVLGKPFPGLFLFPEKAGDADFFTKVLNGETCRLEKQFFSVPGNGRSGYLSGKIMPRYDIEGHFLGGVAFLHDSENNFSTFKPLEAAEGNYTRLINHSPKAIVVFSADEVLFVNNKTLELLGLNHPSEIIGKNPVSFVVPHQQKDAFQTIQEILSNELKSSVEYSLVRKDGTEIKTEITYLSIQYMGKKAIQAVIRDVTEERKAFTELVNHKQMLHEAQAMAKLGSYRLNLTNGKCFWTEGLFRIFELPANQKIASLETYFEFTEESDRKVLKKLIQELKEGEQKEASYIHKVKLLKGKEKYVRIVGKPKLNEEGVVTIIDGTVQDITETKKVEEELFRANQIQNLHFENSPLGIIQLNSELKITGWSKQMENIFGWKAEDVNGIHIASFHFLNEELQESFYSINKENSYHYLNYKKNNVQLYTRNNTNVYCDMFMSGIKGEDGKLQSVLILLNDVTSRKLSEQAHLDGQLEERKRIAREIHDGIGQMLIAIKYKLAGLEECVPEKEFYKVQNLEGMMEQTLEEVRSVSRNLAPRSVATLGLETSLRQMCDQIKKLTAIDINFRYIGGGQEINNKIVNAMYRIAQEATNNIIKHAQAKVANIQVFQGRNFIELKVEDNGKGITHSGANGMGMKNMEERAKLLGGRFQFHSEPGFGTNLIINIPLDQQEN